MSGTVGSSQASQLGYSTSAPSNQQQQQPMTSQSSYPRPSQSMIMSQGKLSHQSNTHGQLSQCHT